MAILTFTLKCDWCNEEYDDGTIDSGFDSPESCQKRATEEGWYVLHGPERHLGGNGVLAFCCGDCLESYVQ